MCSSTLFLWQIALIMHLLNTYIFIKLSYIPSLTLNLVLVSRQWAAVRTQFSSIRTPPQWNLPKWLRIRAYRIHKTIWLNIWYNIRELSELALIKHVALLWLRRYYKLIKNTCQGLSPFLPTVPPITHGCKPTKGLLM